MTFLITGIMPLLVAGLVVYAWHRRRVHMGWPRRKLDYLWAFIHGGIGYVMVALLIGHHVMGFKYGEMLTGGFGDPQVNIAFLAALFEAFWTMWDMWDGNDLTPSAI